MNETVHCEQMPRGKAASSRCERRAAEDRLAFYLCRKLHGPVELGPRGKVYSRTVITKAREPDKGQSQMLIVNSDCGAATRLHGRRRQPAVLRAASLK